LNYETRNRKQEAWLNNTTRVMVCTNAFGMGIDKPDVRTVVHYNVPDCLESYYQEAGRAGRDGKRSYAALLYNTEDERELKLLPGKHFPPVKEIKEIYQCLADYLQIPVGIGEGNYYNFNLDEFIKNFQLDAFAAISTLKMLEQENYISFNENVFLQSTACFVIPKELLVDAEQLHPQLEPVMKCLLRSYEGIYDNKVSINERSISKLLRLHVDEVKQQLQQLHSLHIIEYESPKDTPQIYFITNRASADYLVIDHEKYLQRKKQFAQRVETMLRYIHMSTHCRSKFIGNYFGDNEIEDCGICDNCLKRRSSSITEKEFAAIREKILSMSDGEGMAVQTILKSFKNISKENLWLVLEHLQDGNIIKINIDGTIERMK
jgi:ATP-dependent DNA helicase RecQ